MGLSACKAFWDSRLVVQRVLGTVMGDTFPNHGIYSGNIETTTFYLLWVLRTLRVGFIRDLRFGIWAFGLEGFGGRWCLGLCASFRELQVCGSGIARLRDLIVE